MLFLNTIALESKLISDSHVVILKHYCDPWSAKHSNVFFYLSFTYPNTYESILQVASRDLIKHGIPGMYLRPTETKRKRKAGHRYSKITFIDQHDSYPPSPPRIMRRPIITSAVRHAHGKVCCYSFPSGILSTYTYSPLQSTVVLYIRPFHNIETNTTNISIRAIWGGYSIFVFISRVLSVWHTVNQSNIHGILWGIWFMPREEQREDLRVSAHFRLWLSAAAAAATTSPLRPMSKCNRRRPWI